MIKIDKIIKKKLRILKIIFKRQGFRVIKMNENINRNKNEYYNTMNILTEIKWMKILNEIKMNENINRKKWMKILTEIKLNENIYRNPDKIYHLL